MLDSNSVREFARRNWAIAEQDAASFLVSRRATGSDALRAAHMLWRHMKAVRPEWPDAAARKEDFEHHIRFRALLIRASRAADSF